MGTKHILIVDDAIDLGRLLQDALKTAHPGLPITVVPSAEEAILESTRFTIDLLISDIRLPGMTGLELVQKIRLRQPNIKVMLISGLNIDDQLQRQMDAIHPDTFLHKPMGMPEFLQQCSRLLEMESKPLALDQPKEAGPAAPVDEALMGEVAKAMPGVKPEEIKVKLAVTKPLAQQSETPEPAGLSGRLAAMRSTLGALAILLLDETGRPMEQAGDLSDQALLESLIPAAMLALSSSSRLPYLLSAPAARSVSAFRGKEYDLALAPVGQFAVMAIFKSGRTALRLAIAFEELLNLEEELSTVLEEMGLHIRSAAEVGAPEKIAMAPLAAAQEKTPDQALEEILAGPVVPEPGLEKFEELLSGPGAPQAKEEADSFWESAAGTEGNAPGAPGVLSYEQAKKLGLLP